MRTKKIKAALIGITLITSQALFISFAHAATFLTLDSFSGAPGTTIAVSGGGWTASDTIDIYLGNVSGTPQTTATVQSDGDFSANVTVPANAAQGPLAVTGVDATNNFQASNSFYVVPLDPAITVTAPMHTPFSTVTVTGTGYAPNETVALTLGSASSSAPADPHGNFTGTITIPSTAPGLYLLMAAGEASGAEAVNYFWVDQFYPSASPSTYYILPGKSLSFSGSGFASDETVNVYAADGTSSLAEFTVSSQGSFTNAGAVTISGSAAESVVTYDLVGSLSGIRLPVMTAVGAYYPSLQPSIYYAVPNSSITITGTGFEPNESVAVSANNGTSTAVVADANGNFSAPITIPFSSTKSATIIAEGSSSGATASARVTLASFWPSITPSSWYLYPGQTVSFTGAGFAPNETVALTADGMASTSITADATGGFMTPAITTPYTARNIFTTLFSGALSDATATSQIAIGSLSPYLTANLYSVAQGHAINVQGFGFGANETVNVVAGTFATDTIANAAGTTPPVTIPTPYATSTLNVTFAGDLTGATAHLGIGLTGYTATLSADNYYALPGTEINVNGTGFAPNETIDLYNGSATTTLSASASGTFAAPLTLPFLIGAQNVTLAATGATSGARATATIGFALFDPQVAPSTWFTAPGATVQFTGTGFAPNEPVDVTFANAALAPITASASGTFTFNYTLPVSNASAADFSFYGTETNATIPVAITLSPYEAYIQLSTYYAQGGSPLTITGTGFAPTEPISLYFEGAPIASTTSNASGAFTYNGRVPFSPTGSGKALNAVGDESDATAATTITIAPVYTNLQLGSYAGAPGSAVDFVGSGYLPNEPIAVMTDRTGTSTVYSFNADANGTFNNSGYSIPGSFTGGPLVITITGEHSFDQKSINYYVTGQ